MVAAWSVRTKHLPTIAHLPELVGCGLLAGGHADADLVVQLGDAFELVATAQVACVGAVQRGDQLAGSGQNRTGGSDVIGLGKSKLLSERGLQIIQQLCGRGHDCPTPCNWPACISQWISASNSRASALSGSAWSTTVTADSAWVYMPSLA